jgi:DinB superfamily
MKLHSRRTFLKQGTTACAVSPFLMAALPALPPDFEYSVNGIKLLQNMSNYEYRGLWENLKGITEKEADWKPNAESNSVRWVVGHLCWFEEWMADTIENKGRYLTDKKPMIVTEPTMEALKARFDAAKARTQRLAEAITPEIWNRKVVFVGRYDLAIFNLFQTLVSHTAGHRYQIRYIRGTYSRVFHITNKADFDPW